MRTLAIGDIHGCLTALDALLEIVELRPDDQIITLGDYVDRGPDSRGVIERVLELRTTHSLVALRGNHDLMMIEAHAGRGGAWLACGGKETLASYGVRIRNKLFGFDLIPKAHWKFLEEELVNWYEKGRHLFVHASVNPHLPMEEQDEYTLLWEKVLDPIEHRSGKVIVCGHTKQYSGVPLNLGSTICIDTGVYDDQGWLTCLDVDTGGYWQANQRGQRRTGQLEGPASG
jgi:serine/threonine protein phosphatase 1